MKEVFKKVINFPNYEISNMGYIVDKVRNKNVKTFFSKNSLIVQLRNEHEVKKFLIHRLVALHFLENPNNYFFITHLDGNHRNNQSDNLQYEHFFKNRRRHKKTTTSHFDAIITFD